MRRRPARGNRVRRGGRRLIPMRHVWPRRRRAALSVCHDTGELRARRHRARQRRAEPSLRRPPPARVAGRLHGRHAAGSPRPTCDSCCERARCGRRFRFGRGTPFAREEAGLQLPSPACAGVCRRRLWRAALPTRWTAHPLGCRAVHRLDPDEVSLARLRAEFPEGLFTWAASRTFGATRPRVTDHILCLRR